MPGSNAREAFETVVVQRRSSLTSRAWQTWLIEIEAFALHPADSFAVAVGFRSSIPTPLSDGGSPGLVPERKEVR